eukprot:TRINITY_DN18435_c0_g1_i2.p1 TRINITY_DN18435_c0_g1~~TRINITY_DN18435_c0_g1_i2.p1  ORF type:complete len:954 (-),score=282.37 TRINITY_DN18435_c0_g1_i2:39-2594(-)
MPQMQAAAASAGTDPQQHQQMTPEMQQQMQLQQMMAEQMQQQQQQMQMMQQQQMPEQQQPPSEQQQHAQMQQQDMQQQIQMQQQTHNQVPQIVQPAANMQQRMQQPHHQHAQQQAAQQQQQPQHQQSQQPQQQQQQFSHQQQVQQPQHQQPAVEPPARQQNQNPLTGAPYTPRFYYLLEKRQRLPAWSARQEFLRLMQTEQVLACIGEPGSGKSTQLPQILLDAGYHVQGSQVRAIACVQPNSLSSVSAAQRICEELEVQLGTFVGYVTRFEDKTSSDTLLRFLADEALVREALEDPLLERYSVIIIDEVHERSLPTDILLGCLKMVMQRRPELKLVLLGASEAVQMVQSYFGEQTLLLQLPNRTHPIDVFHCEEAEKDYLKAAIRTVVQIHTTETEGDILVFLPVEDEIDLACQMLRKEATQMMTSGELVVRPLYVGLPLSEHQKVFESAPAAKMLGGTGGKPGRKVVVATTIAETSIAIDNITYIIDSGLAKQKAFNPRTRVEGWIVAPIQRSSALHRAKLAGRMRPGKCFRLYQEKILSSGELPERIAPEIMRSNLCSMVLMLKRLGFDDVVHFDYVDPPSPEALMRALESLNFLGCLDDNGNITELGNQACRLPMEPQMARMLIQSPHHRCSNEALSIVAMLCSLPVWLRPNDAFRAANEAKARFAHMDGDHLTLLNVFHAFKQQLQDGQDVAKFCAENFISLRAMRHAEMAREQLKRLMEGLGLQMVSTDFQDKEYYPNIRRCLVSGYFMQTACLESEKKGLYALVRGGDEVTLHPSTSLGHKPDWVVFHDYGLSSKLCIKTATQVKPEWLLDAAPSFFDLQKISDKGPGRQKMERVISKRQQQDN